MTRSLAPLTISFQLIGSNRDPVTGAYTEVFREWRSFSLYWPWERQALRDQLDQVMNGTKLFFYIPLVPTAGPLAFVGATIVGYVNPNDPTLTGNYDQVVILATGYGNIQTFANFVAPQSGSFIDHGPNSPEGQWRDEPIAVTLERLQANDPEKPNKMVGTVTQKPE